MGELSLPLSAQEPRQITELRVKILSGNDQSLIIGSTIPFKDIVVQVVDNANRAVEGALVTVTLEAGLAPDGSNIITGLTSDSEGKVMIRGIKPGRKTGSWSVRVRASYQGAVEATVALNMTTEATANGAPATPPATPPASAAATPATAPPSNNPSTAAPPSTSTPAGTPSTSAAASAPNPTASASGPTTPAAPPLPERTIPTQPPPPKKSSKTALILLIVAGGAGGGIAAAMAGKKSSPTGPPSGGVQPSVTTIGITIGSGGGFGSPGGPR